MSEEIAVIELAARELYIVMQEIFRNDPDGEPARRAQAEEKWDEGRVRGDVLDAFRMQAKALHRAGLLAPAWVVEGKA